MATYYRIDHCNNLACVLYGESATGQFFRNDAKPAEITLAIINYYQRDSGAETELFRQGFKLISDEEGISNPNSTSSCWLYARVTAPDNVTAYAHMVGYPEGAPKPGAYGKFPRCCAGSVAAGFSAENFPRIEDIRDRIDRTILESDRHNRTFLCFILIGDERKRFPVTMRQKGFERMARSANADLWVKINRFED